MVLLYGAILFIWLTAMSVAEKKSWAELDISKGINLVQILIRLAVVVVASLLLNHFDKFSESFHFDNLWMAPIGVVCFYGLYVLFGRKHREQLSEFFKVDKWNAMVLLSCIFMSFSASMM